MPSVAHKQKYGTTLEDKCGSKCSREDANVLQEPCINQAPWKIVDDVLSQEERYIILTGWNRDEQTRTCYMVGRIFLMSQRSKHSVVFLDAIDGDRGAMHYPSKDHRSTTRSSLEGFDCLECLPYLFASRLNSSTSPT